MATAHCACGFTEHEAGNETIGDHLFHMFAPEDDKGTDGRVHLEGRPDLTCTCGLAAATAQELDAHLVAAFTPNDAIGHDGNRHQLVS
jgi:hypothetical protein